MSAVYANQFRTVEMLLFAGADPNLSNQNGWTALHLTLNTSDVSDNDASDIAKLLLQFNAHIDPRNKVGDTPLNSAARRGKDNTFNVLLDAKANVNSRNIYGVTPLMSAVIGGHRLIFERLLGVGSDVNMVSLRGCTALRYSVIHNQSDMYARLIAQGAGPNLGLGQGCDLIEDIKLVAGL